jgi:hypothetical protein
LPAPFKQFFLCGEAKVEIRDLLYLQIIRLTLIMYANSPFRRGATNVIRSVWIVATLQCAFVSQLVAQDGSLCDGTWKYTHTDKARGRPADVDVKISGDRGTYFAHLGQHKAKNSPCRDKEFPVFVEICTAEELVFRVLGNTVLEGCPAFTARFKRTGPDTAEGTISRGQLVSARRER